MAIWDFASLDLNRKIKSGLGFSLLLLLVSSVVSFVSIRILIDRAWWVDHTNQVLIDLENTISVMKDAETGQRGYLITKDENFLVNYYDGHSKVTKFYGNVRLLTKDNPAQQRYLDTLKPIIDSRFVRLTEVIKIFEKTGKISEPDMVVGKDLMVKARNLIAKMKIEEQKLLDDRTRDAGFYSNATQIVITVSSLIALLISGLSLYFISKDIKNKEKTQKELQRLNDDLETSNIELVNNRNELDRHNYILTGNTQINDLLRGEKDLDTLAKKVLTHICEYVKAQAGVFYVLGEDGKYHLRYVYAFEANENVPSVFRQGEGLLGQSALQMKRIAVENIPSSGIRIQSGLTSLEPSSITIIPFFQNEQTVAVAEIISTRSFQKADNEFLDAISSTIAIFINNIKAEVRTAELLSETQNQAEELEAQQEELRSMNDDLREQRDRLQASEEELRASEEELQEKNAELEIQYDSIRSKNRELESAKQAVQIKMEQFETVSKYKSEFLANMSHELRTPLNSILILATILKDNQQKHLSAKEVEHASIIERAGNDLLKLINEILDLSRIESGRVKLELNHYSVKDFQFEMQFKELAKEKNIDFKTNVSGELTEKMYTDKFRLEQIMKNLLSNAFKFTPEGGKVEFSISQAPSTIKYSNSSLTGKKVVAFSVKDNGIGIPDEKLAIVFEAFQQADPSTTRRYGGSGLGLTISRDLAQLLGGEIQVESKLNFGSTFTLYLPEKMEHDATLGKEVSVQELPVVNPIFKKGLSVMEPSKEGKKSILIIEDDFYFSKTLADYANGKGYEVFVANAGQQGIDLAKKHRPDAILLDVQLPDINGWEVLKKLKNDPNLQSIAVHMMSAYDKEGFNVQLGQENFIPKPITLEMLDRAFADVSRKKEKFVKKVLIIEDNEIESLAIKELLGHQEIESETVNSGEEGLEKASKGKFDCVVLDINLPDINGYDVLEKLKTTSETKELPVIIYSGKDLTEEEENKFNKYADTIIVKTEYSYTRLLEEVKLFMHSMGSNLTDSIKRKVQKSEALLNNKKVLIADDDMRNIYSLSSILEDHGMRITVAYDGKQALEELEANPDTDIVLMDIMMPTMDGIEATMAIRAKPQYKDLPIIAVTAKAMPEDKEKCMAAGVSDYIAKPIDINKLLSLMRVWIYRS